MLVLYETQNTPVDPHFNERTKDRTRRHFNVFDLLSGSLDQQVKIINGNEGSGASK